MSKTKWNDAEPVDFYEMAKDMLPTLPWFPRTEDMAERMAALIVEKHFLVRYDEVSAPVIDAAVLRNPYLEQDDLMAFLHCLGDNEYIILLDSENHPPVLADLIGDEAGYVEFLTYNDCVDYAETELNYLLRFQPFDYRRYMLYLGGAFAIVKAEHPDWIYETFIECFRKDVVDKMAERSKDYLGYREFVNSEE